jgi:hypothetical protein
LAGLSAGRTSFVTLAYIEIENPPEDSISTSPTEDSALSGMTASAEKLFGTCSMVKL